MKKISLIATALFASLCVLCPLNAKADANDYLKTTVTSAEDVVTVTVSMEAGSQLTNGKVVLDVTGADVEVLDSESSVYGDLADFNADALSYSWVAIDAQTEAADLFSVSFKVKDAVNGQVVTAEAAYSESYADGVAVKAGNAVKATTTLSLFTVSDLADVEYYAGRTIKPELVVVYGNKTLKAGKDYTVTYANNKGVGVATATVTGKGNYAGKTVTKTFNIVPAEINADNTTVKFNYAISILGSDAAVTVKAPTVTKGSTKIYNLRDFTFEVQDANGKKVTKIQTAGTYTVVVTATGNYTGTVTKTVEIVKNEYKIGKKVIGYNWDVRQ